jgi:uncharacterized protein (DUF362 family)
VHRLLAAAGLVERLQGVKTLLLKPNLVEALSPPITTPVDLVEEVVDFLQESCVSCEVLVGEGTGSVEYDTHHCFSTLGYTAMAARRGIKLVDLNNQPQVQLRNGDCTRWPEMFLPRLVLDSFLLSMPVLKAHSLAKVTLTMKNMMGCVPPSHYRSGNSWGKSAFHQSVQESVFDLNRYRTPDFTLLDASVGMAEAHLWGRHCQPPVGKLVASWDPVAVDAYGATLLHREWQKIGHIQMADNVLGRAEPVQLVRC